MTLLQRKREHRDHGPGSRELPDSRQAVHTRYWMSDMNGKVALITGASSGIGRATAEAFAARGAEVVLAARRESELATLTSEIESRGGKASFVVTDVAIAKDVERMVAHRSEERRVGKEWRFRGS